MAGSKHTDVQSLDMHVKHLYSKGLLRATDVSIQVESGRTHVQAFLNVGLLDGLFHHGFHGTSAQPVVHLVTRAAASLSGSLWAKRRGT